MSPDIAPGDLLWLAGLCEGEATFDLHRGKYPRLRIGMTDRDVIVRAAGLLGATVRLSLHGAPAQATWHTEISGARAASAMRALLPHMGARRSGKIATVLGHASLPFAASSAPGPRIPTLPAAAPAA